MLGTHVSGSPSFAVNLYTDYTNTPILPVLIPDAGMRISGWMGVLKLSPENDELNSKVRKVMRSIDEQIELQSKLLEATDGQLQAIGSAVEKSGKSSLASETKSYSPVITPATAQKIAVSMVKEDKRASHVMLFYMEEKKGEDLRQEVQQVFSAI